MKIFERSDFAGQNLELMEDCPDLHERFHTRDISSANVLEGYWMLHEHPNYRGRQYFLRPGEYRRHSEWGSASSTFGSLRRVTELNWFPPLFSSLPSPFFFLKPHCSSQLSFPPSCSTSLFERCLNTVVSKPEITPWQGFVGFWFCLGKKKFLSVVPQQNGFAATVPNLLSHWNDNKWKLDESQLKGAFVNFLLPTTAVIIRQIMGIWLFHESL